jgi:transcription elongation GreA/GreB family factor
VKQQADQLELLELSQMGADMAGKQDAERAHLAARHCRERDSASKKAASAVLAAQQRQGYKVEQLTRRYQVGKTLGAAGQVVSVGSGCVTCLVHSTWTLHIRCTVYHDKACTHET